MDGLVGRALAILNPAAGGGRAFRLKDELVRLFREAGRHVEIVQTNEAGDGARLAREAVDDGYARIIAVGGDGTVHEVVNGMIGTDCALAVVPLGNANDFAHALGVTDWRYATRIAVLGRTRRFDAALAYLGPPEARQQVLLPGSASGAAEPRQARDRGGSYGRAFANAAGVGVDAVGARTLESHKRYFGPLSYFTAAVATLSTYRPRSLRLLVDGRAVEGRHLLVVAANTERFGKGMRIAPGAVPDDGLLDVCVVGDTNLFEQLWLLPQVYWGGHVHHPKVQMLRVRSLVIEQEEVLPVELDGEVSAAERVEIECVPGGLYVVTP